MLRMALAALFGLILAAPVQATEPLTIGFEAPTTTAAEGGTLIDRCSLVGPTDIKNGENCVYLPDGGRLAGITWQSTAKATNHEFLLIVMSSPYGESLGEPNEKRLITTHHYGEKSTIVTKDVLLPRTTRLQPGYVWVHTVGRGDLHNAGIEVQATLWVE